MRIWIPIIIMLCICLCIFQEADRQDRLVYRPNGAAYQLDERLQRSQSPKPHQNIQVEAPTFTTKRGERKSAPIWGTCGRLNLIAVLRHTFSLLIYLASICLIYQVTELYLHILLENLVLD